MRYLKDKMAGKDVSRVEFPGTIKHMPDNFTKWKEDNHGRIEAMKRKGTLPEFLKEASRIVDARKQPKEPLPEHVKERRKEIRRIAIETLAGKQIHLPQIGVTATISNRGIKEWLNQPFANIEAKNEALLDLRSLFENSVYRGNGVDEHMTTATMHLFETKISDCKCWLVVRQFHDNTCLVWSISDNPSILNNIHQK